VAAGRDDFAARSLIGLMLRFSSVVKKVADENEIRECMEPKWRAVVDLILDQWQKQRKVDIFEVTQNSPPEAASEIAALALEGEALTEDDGATIAADCVSHLRRKYLRGLERDLRIAIRVAEEQEDETAKRERMLEWQDVKRKERQLERRKPQPRTNLR
jgi:hypothetical protein